MSDRLVCETLDEYRIAKAAWSAAGRPGGRLGSPVLAAMKDCVRCGKPMCEPELLPAFHFGPRAWCTCAPLSNPEGQTDG
jgi:hypothetical protein